MTHNVKIISERTDIKSSISYLPGKKCYRLSGYNQMNFENFKENDI